MRDSRYRGLVETPNYEVGWSPWQVFVTGALVVVVGSGIWMVSCATGLVGGVAQNTSNVIQKEFYPSALLQKYEWFKDASAALDKKQADLGVYNARLLDLKQAHEGEVRSKWPRDDREQYSIWSSEAAGIKASYNQLAAEYNAEMVKFNWRFTNVGDVPQGGRPLPRDYKPYIEQ